MHKHTKDHVKYLLVLFLVLSILCSLEIMKASKNNYITNYNYICMSRFALQRLQEACNCTNIPFGEEQGGHSIYAEQLHDLIKYGGQLRGEYRKWKEN